MEHDTERDTINWQEIIADLYAKSDGLYNESILHDALWADDCERLSDYLYDWAVYLEHGTRRQLYSSAEGFGLQEHGYMTPDNVAKALNYLRREFHNWTLYATDNTNDDTFVVAQTKDFSGVS